MRWLTLLAVLAAAPAAAQYCVGDCDGDGMVSVAELIAGVRIAQGNLELSACRVFDVTPDGTLRIDELVRGVGFALTGCAPTPTPTDSPEPSRTPTESDTPAATATASTTPTIPPVAGRWREEVLGLKSSSCDQVLTDEFAAQLVDRGPCEQLVERSGETGVRVTDCTDQAIDGELDRDGTIRLIFPPNSDTVEDCTVTLATRSAIPAAISPTTASYTFQLSFSGACELDDCAIDAEGTWTRLE
ncbi:MAG: hypothetical protein AB7V27_08140 [Candidatus Binatia bacterium]